MNCTITLASAFHFRRLSGALALGASLVVLPLASTVAEPLPSGLAAPGSTDLRQVVQQAILTNPEVQAAWSGLRAAGNDIGVARGNYLPSVDVSAGVGRERREMDDRGSYDISYAELTVTQMLWDGLATASEVERLDRAELVRYYELLGASEEIALDATRAYIDVQRYRELVRLAQDNYREHLQVRNQIEARVASGTGRRVDLEQISGRLALAESNLMTEASNLHDVTARYQRIVGDLPTENLAPAPEMDDHLPADANRALDLAFLGNPEFHAAIENIEASRAEQRATRSAFQPRVDLRGRTGTYENSDGSYDPIADGDRRGRHTIELVASMNLYRGGSDLASFRAASDRVEQAINLREKACVDVRQTTQIAYNDTQRLREQLRYLNEHRQAINRVRGAYQQQFEIGQRTLLDLLDSENEYFEASRAYANARYDVALADARTLAAMGQLMQTLDVRRDDLPTLAELGSDGVQIDPDAICPAQGPEGFRLNDFIGLEGTSRSTSFADPTQARKSTQFLGDESAELYSEVEQRASEPVASAQSAQGFLQVAALSSKARASDLGERLVNEFDLPFRLVAAGSLHRVQLGPIDDPTLIPRLRRRLAASGYGDSFLVSG